jgi:hypothetical protein
VGVIQLNHQKVSKLKSFIKHIPFIILLVNGILILLASKYDFDWMYWIVPQISGHGILTVIFMLFYAHTHRFCLYSWVCIVGLGLLNVLNILYFFSNFEYYQIYSGIIVFTALTFAVIKWMEIYYFKWWPFYK